jgi:hypothetical protein
MALVLWTIAAGVVFADDVDLSSFSKKDTDRLEKIVEQLEPVHALQRTLDALKVVNMRDIMGKPMFGPMWEYLKTQMMKVDLIFNEYGLEYSIWDDYEVSNNQKLKVILAKLRSRYLYLEDLKNKNADELKAILAILKE